MAGYLYWVPAWHCRFITAFNHFLHAALFGALSLPQLFGIRPIMGVLRVKVSPQANKGGAFGPDNNRHIVWGKPCYVCSGILAREPTCRVWQGTHDPMDHIDRRLCRDRHLYVGASG
jgi:hypothetical protein